MSNLGQGVLGRPTQLSCLAAPLPFTQGGYGGFGPNLGGNSGLFSPPWASWGHGLKSGQDRT